MASASSSSGPIVIVEDEEDTRELLREVLESGGHQVLTAEDGLMALEVLRSTPAVRLVLIDLLMPRMDGFGLLAAMAADAALARLRVVVTTSAPEKVPAGLACLPKPVDIARLLAVAEESLAP